MTTDVKNIESLSTGRVNLAAGLKIQGDDISASVNLYETYTGSAVPSSPKNGAFWFNGTALHTYIDSTWRVLETSFAFWYGSRGLTSGGYRNGSETNEIAYITIATTGNSTDFGNLIGNTTGITAFGSSTRTIFANGQENGNYSNRLSFVVPSTTGNAVDTNANLIAAVAQRGSASNGVRGIIAGGIGSSRINTLESFEIATSANAISFGTVMNPLPSGQGSSSISNLRGWGNGVRAFFAGGSNGSSNNLLVSRTTVQFDTPGNSTLAGSMSTANGRDQMVAAGSRTRMVMQGGRSNGASSATVNYPVIDFFEMNSTATATSFGTMNVGRYQHANVSNATRICSMGGRNASGTLLNSIEYITIATPGNGTDFGDLSAGISTFAGASGA